MTKPGTNPPESPVRGSSLLPALLAGLIVALVLVSVAPPRLGGTNSSGRWTGPGEWTNGVVKASFAANYPAVTVASTTAQQGYGLYAGVSGMLEWAPDGSAVAGSDFTSVNWTVANSSTGNQVALSYSVQAPVTRLGGHSTLGMVDVTVNFSGIAPAQSSGSASFVGFGLTVSDWPWVGGADLLGVVMPLWPNNLSLEHLVAPPGADRVNCLSYDDSSAKEYFSWESQANASSGGGMPQALRATPNVNGNSGYATVTIEFGGAAGGYSTLRYDPQVGVFLPASSELTVVDYAAVGVGLAGLTATVVILQRRAWSRAPSLDRIGGA